MATARPLRSLSAGNYRWCFLSCASRSYTLLSASHRPRSERKGRSCKFAGNVMESGDTLYLLANALGGTRILQSAKASCRFSVGRNSGTSHPARGGDFYEVLLCVSNVSLCSELSSQ